MKFRCLSTALLNNNLLTNWLQVHYLITNFITDIKKCLTFCRIGLWSSFLALAFGKFLSGRHDRKTWSCNNHNSAETNQYLVTYGNHKPHEDTAVKKSKGKLLINYIPPQFAAISPLLQASRIGLWGEVPRAERTNQ